MRNRKDGAGKSGAALSTHLEIIRLSRPLPWFFR